MMPTGDRFRHLWYVATVSFWIARHFFSGKGQYAGFNCEEGEVLDDTVFPVQALVRLGLVVEKDTTPSWDERFAFRGTSGKPSVYNRYVTDSDPRLQGGGGGAFIVQKNAAMTLSGHRVVKVSGPDNVAYADAGTETDADLVFGITLGAALSGLPVQVATPGAEVIESSWSWVPNQQVFCGLNGMLTQVVTGGLRWLKAIGVAESPTTLFIISRPSILLS